MLGIGDGHRFGDLALQDLARGEYWRLITSTFIHFSVLHLVLNLIAMYQLGTMVESWYGTPQSIFIYGVTGGGGNLVSVLIRHGIGSNPRIHSGGGSVVIMGLVGLCAVVGLRSRTELGVSMGRLMVFFMVTTAILGAVLPQFIDNWGHAGGAVVGIALGFAHRGLSASRQQALGLGERRGDGDLDRGVRSGPGRRRQTGGASARRAGRDSPPVRARDGTIRCWLGRRFWFASRPTRETVLKLLDSLSFSSAGNPPPPADLRRLRALAQAAKNGPLSAEESRELTDRLNGLLDQARRDYMAERRELWRLRDGPRVQRER